MERKKKLWKVGYFFSHVWTKGNKEEKILLENLKEK